MYVITATRALAIVFALTHASESLAGICKYMVRSINGLNEAVELRFGDTVIFSVDRDVVIPSVRFTGSLKEPVSKAEGESRVLKSGENTEAVFLGRKIADDGGEDLLVFLDMNNVTHFVPRSSIEGLENIKNTLAEHPDLESQREPSTCASTNVINCIALMSGRSQADPNWKDDQAFISKIKEAIDSAARRRRAAEGLTVPDQRVAMAEILDQEGMTVRNSLSAYALKQHLNKGNIALVGMPVDASRQAESAFEARVQVGDSDVDVSRGVRPLIVPEFAPRPEVSERSRHSYMAIGMAKSYEFGGEEQVILFDNHNGSFLFVSFSQLNAASNNLDFPISYMLVERN